MIWLKVETIAVVNCNPAMIPANAITRNQCSVTNNGVTLAMALIAYDPGSPQEPPIAGMTITGYARELTHCCFGDTGLCG